VIQRELPIGRSGTAARGYLCAGTQHGNYSGAIKAGLLPFSHVEGQAWKLLPLVASVARGRETIGTGAGTSGWKQATPAGVVAGDPSTIYDVAAGPEAVLV
jgi:hypothetical protein